MFTSHLPPGGRIRIANGPAVHPHSISAARKAYPDPEWSSRSSSLAIRRRGRRIRTASGPGVYLHSLSATRKAYLVPEWSSRSSLFAIRYPPQGRRIRTPCRPSSLAIRGREGVFGRRMVQPFIPTRYPPPGRRIRNPRGLGVYLHSRSTAAKAYPDTEWSRRSSSLAIHRQEGVLAVRELSSRLSSLAIRQRKSRFGLRAVQSFMFTRYPPPGSRIRTPSGLAVHLHSPSTVGRAYPDREWSRRSSPVDIRRQEGVSGPRVVQPSIFTRYPLPGTPIRTASCPGVYCHSIYPTRKAYEEPEGSRRLCSLAIRRQEGVSGPRVVPSFIFTRHPPPGRRIRSASCPVVYLRSLSAARKNCSDLERLRRSSSLTIHRREGVSGP